MSARSVQDRFALHKSVIRNNVVEVESLLKKSPGDVTVEDDTDDGNTPLHYAAITGSLKIVDLLLEKNSTLVNKGNKRGKTPLHLAAEHDHVMVATRLIEKRADINQQDNGKLTSLLTAAKHNSPLVVDELLKNKKTDITGEKGKTVLHFATENNSTKVLKILLKYDEDIESRFKEIKELLNIVDEDERAPLHVAAQSGYLQCLKTLIKNGADVFQTCKEKKTVLHLAAAEGWTE